MYEPGKMINVQDLIIQFNILPFFYINKRMYNFLPKFVTHLIPCGGTSMCRGTLQAPSADSNQQRTRQKGQVLCPQVSPKRRQIPIKLRTHKTSIDIHHCENLKARISLRRVDRVHFPIYAPCPLQNKMCSFHLTTSSFLSCYALCCCLILVFQVSVNITMISGSK